MIDAETAAFVAERGAYVVPTLSILFSLLDLGEKLGFPPENQAKAIAVSAECLAGLDHMRSAGVKLGFGTDLLGELYTRQCREFSLRSDVFSPFEILRQATSGSAAVLMEEDRLGCVAPGAHADLIIVDGDPLADIGLLAADGNRLDVIMRAGEIVKNRL